MFKLKYTVILLIIVMLFAGCAPADQTDPTSSSPGESVQEKTEETGAEEAEDDPAPEEPAKAKGELTVHYIDVGQGDSILIQAPDKDILIDGGDRGNTVVNYLRNLNIDTLDIVIGTHPHADHIGGLINVLQSFEVTEVIDPGVVHTTITFEDYLTIIDEKDIKFTEGRAGMERDLGGGAIMEIVHPTSPSSNHLNNASIVARIAFGDVSFLITGDAEQEAERQMLNRGYTLDSTILKVGHHGSRTSTTSRFLDAVNPEAAVIMCGEGNSYGHPHDETLSSLNDAGVDIYRTDLQGTIVITTDGDEYSIEQEPVSYQEQAQPPPEEDIDGEFVGSVNSDRYHYPDCRHARNISPGNLVVFDSLNDAKNAGYVPCGGCRPPG